MPFRVSVVIPVLNGADEIEGAVLSAFAAGAAEVIVADGGSIDGTPAIARQAGATVVDSESVRGRQMNAGAALATGDAILFLHADTRLPTNAAAAVEDAIERGCRHGGFALRFRERRAGLRLAERLINLRTRITRCPWGDQAQWFETELFRRAGGYRPDPLMEDYEIAVRMKRLDRAAILEPPVVTSGARFLARGLLRTAITNWWIILRWRLGADPARLAALYRKR